MHGSSSEALMRSTTRVVGAAAIAVLLAAPVGADDWPQWRGPNRDGKSAETGLLQSWPDNGPPLAWKVLGVGGGYSSLSIADGRIFTMGDLGNSQYVIALSEASGEVLWRARIAPRWDDSYGGPRATPTIDGDDKPRWDYKLFTSTAAELTANTLKVVVWDDDSWGTLGDDKLGECQLTITQKHLAAGSFTGGCTSKVQDLKFTFTTP